MREQARHRRPARISVAPIKTSPSLQTSDGALTTGVDLLELRKRSEDGEGTVLEANTQKLQRDRHPAHVRRIKHSDQLHGLSLSISATSHTTLAFACANASFSVSKIRVE